MVYKLICTFVDSEGAKFNLIVNNVDPELSEVTIKDFMQVCIDTGVILNKQTYAPASMFEATIVQTTETKYELAV